MHTRGTVLFLPLESEVLKLPFSSIAVRSNGKMGVGCFSTKRNKEKHKI